MPVMEILKKKAPWAIEMFQRRTTGEEFLNDMAVANLTGITRMNSSGEYQTFWCIIGEKSIGLFNNHGSQLYKEKGWAVSFPLSILSNVRLVPGQTTLTYSNGDSYVADYWILNWPISHTKPWPEMEENSTLGFWARSNNPIDPHLDLISLSKKDPLYERWIVLLTFEESGDPQLRNKYADALAKQISHLPGFKKDDAALITQSVHLKIPQTRQSGGWFSFVGVVEGD
jgi:hypothetical protein